MLAVKDMNYQNNSIILLNRVYTLKNAFAYTLHTPNNAKKHFVFIFIWKWSAKDILPPHIPTLSLLI